MIWGDGEAPESTAEPCKVQANSWKSRQDPGPFPAPIVVAVGVADDPMEQRGKLKRVSPEELPHALLLRIGDQI